MTDSPTITARWEDLDADGDGVITKAEWEAVAQAQAPSTGGAESDIPATREHDKTAALAQRLGCSKREAAQALKLAAGHAGKAAKRLRAAGFGDGARAGMEKSLEPEEAEQHSARRGTISAAEVQNWLGDDSGEEGAQSESSTDDDVDAALLAKMQATPHRKLAALSPSRPLRKSPESMGTADELSNQKALGSKHALRGRTRATSDAEQEKALALAQRFECSKEQAFQVLRASSGHAGKAAKKLRQQAQGQVAASTKTISAAESARTEKATVAYDRPRPGSASSAGSASSGGEGPQAHVLHVCFPPSIFVFGTDALTHFLLARYQVGTRLSRRHCNCGLWV